MNNPFNTPIKKGKFYKELSDSISKLAIDLINIIYHYAKNENDHAEYYHNTINCKDQLLYGVEEITILGDNLYIKEYQYNKILVYDLKTFKLIDTIRDIHKNDIFWRYIQKYIRENKKSICSGYCPLVPNHSMKNFWCHWGNKGEDKFTCNDKYRFVWRFDERLIHIFDQITKKRVHVIPEKYSPKETATIDWINYNTIIEQVEVSVYKKYYKTNIIVYNNILYIIGYYLYYCIDGLGRNHSFSDNYIHLYDTNTFEFIREFTKTNRHDVWNRPTCMAITDDLIIICLNNRQCEVWTKEDCF
jgi:hypothetical protein